MNQLVITALLILGLIIAVLIYEMPFIYGSAYTAPMELGNDSLIIAISDLHLESNERDLGCIGNYLRGLGEDGIYLIINGDLFDKAHGQVLGQSHITELIRRLGLAGISELRGVVYVMAMYDHDPRIGYGEVKYFIDGVNVRVVRGVVKLVIGGRTFWFLHGDYVVKNGLIASLINKLFSGSYDKLVRFAVRAGEGDWVVIGHTHVPGINTELRVANTGSWINRFISATDTAIVIDGSGNVKLINIKCSS
ncbi:hypothetical protein [Vulcanisaeta distributa]|uniref:Calcineurin-like phosphoesterase domain-containing protein n=1 Tax=Vulcanisaeta distributa (strain DSM 14429 / JCM 11212 / NBRC 100878 / IC-017) TaxID=572478 RepID=E1QQ65_VULDI|nr:hypothetical protein [Vulcanisaeta distributa]ADN50437.1 conserved hypothetical protein [Vulcanisaeta distributa DSM 14429]